VHLSVVIPVSNQKDKIFSVCEALDHGLKNLSLDYEIIFLDDASRDGSKALLEEIVSRRKRVRSVTNTKRLSFGESLRVLFREAKGDAIVYMDIASSIGIGAFPTLIEKLHDADIVIASRFGQRKPSEVFPTSFLFQTYLLMCKFLFKLRIQDIHPKLMFLYRDVALSLDLKALDRNIFPELFLRSRKKNLIVQEFFVDSSYLSRQPRQVQGCSFFTFVGLFGIGQ